MIFKSFIIKLNKKSTGFIKLPETKRFFFKEGEQIKVTINTKPNSIVFYAKIRKCGVLGVYVPKNIMEQNNFKKECKTIFEIIKGIFVKISSDGRIYLPNTLGKKLELKSGDIVKLELLINHIYETVFCKINARKKPNTVEYHAFLSKEFYNKKCIIIGMHKLDKNKINFKHKLDFDKILKKFTFVELDKNRIMLYLGNRVPIKINITISLNKIAHYLGCFFADGTKRGNSWGICASTFEQADYFKKMHNQIIPDNNLRFSITITLNSYVKKRIIKTLNLWKNKCGVDVPFNKVCYILSKSKISTNRNKFGTLVIKEHRQLTQIYYNTLISYLLNIIKKKNNALLAQDFICGVIEGDGCLNARGRGHIQITTNKREVKILEKFLRYSKLEFNIYKEKTGKVYANVGGLSILNNLERLGTLLFKYYPKRRKILIERLCSTPSAKFLKGKQKTISPWIKYYFVKKRILTKKYLLTEKGKKIKKALLSMEKELLA